MGLSMGREGMGLISWEKEQALISVDLYNLLG